jgi:4-amino-4-deoxy-L-arabinose transferase-like glycosyltransferase
VTPVIDPAVIDIDESDLLDELLGSDVAAPTATTRRRARWKLPHPTWVGHLPNRRPSRGTVASVSVLIAVATFLRIWRLNTVGLRGDEAVYAGQAALLAHTDGMSRWFIAASRGNSNFLVYQWIVSNVYRVVGVSDIAARSVTATFSILTVLLVYLIGRLLYGQREAFLAGLFIAVSGYAVALGRLALLDATACLFLTVAMFCLLKWHNSDRFSWLAGFTIATAIAMQTKVTSVVIIPIVAVFIAASGDWRRLTWRRLTAALLVGAVSLGPAGYQIVSNHAHVLSFLGTSTTRSSGVPWYYYLHTLWSAEGVLLSSIFALGVARPIFKRSRADMLPLIWLIVFGLFLQIYPLKAFNYLLPIIPPLALLAGRSASLVIDSVSLIGRRLTDKAVRVSAVATAATVLAVFGSQLSAVRTAVADESSVGMREAAYWLRAHGAQRAGAMTLSHGSGQYVLSFYGGIDSFPFGRFRIATVLPGGALIRTTARGSDKVPLDWVRYWPSRLIGQGRVAYLVYNTRPLDDPPEQSQIAGTSTERQFRSLIQQYGGRLVHTVYWHHEARVYIYRVTKRLARPVLQTHESGNRVVVNAKGFVASSPLTVTYHGTIIAHTTADAAGAAIIYLPIPDPGQSQYHLRVSDAEGNASSVTGLPSQRIVYTIDNGIVRVFGVRYRPGGVVKLSYGKKRLGQTVARPDGTFTWTFRLPANTHARYRVEATDDSGRTAWAIGLPAPSLAFVVSGHNADVTGAHYLPNTTVTVTYHGRTIALAQTDTLGGFRLRFEVPYRARTGYQLIASDPIGRQAIVTGLERR